MYKMFFQQDICIGYIFYGHWFIFKCCSTPLTSCCLPADYTVTQLEALTVLCHYCLLDSTQQLSNAFSQQLLAGSGTIHMGIPGANPGQIFNNLIHVFMPTPLQQVVTSDVHLTSWWVYTIFFRFVCESDTSSYVVLLQITYELWFSLNYIGML